MSPLRRAVVTVGILFCASCAPARAAVPPEPSLVAGERADASTTTTIRRTTPTSSTVRPPRMAGGSRSATTTSTSTTSTLPHPTGWAGFDEIVSYDLLTHGDTSASVAVMIEGELVHASAFGVRVAGTYDLTEPVDRFRIASVSKVITAIVTLQLVEDGLLAIDEPVGERVASYLGVTASPTAAQITVEQLLSHTSGFGTFYTAFFQGGATSCPDAARQGITSRSGGSGYGYSNMNYCVLGMLIEAVTGLPYEQAVYERLLTPLGITGMRLASTFDVGPDEVLHASEPGRTYMETLGGAGSWIATPTDIVRIVDSLNPGGPGWQPLSDEMAIRMRRGRYGISGVAASYGLGLFNFADGSFGHTGTIESTHAMVVARPDRITWALMVNGEYPGDTSDLKTIVDNALDVAFD
ncbi:MAG TPA: serine hydrolase domain-containing protein [Ilumatobacteraceae bacterium]|nr:serine hydrolase domain-containing protein [Ilumatobacteraceae bacterium]